MLLELMMLVLLLMHLVVPVLVISSFAANKISIKQLYAFDENVCESASLVFYLQGEVDHWYTCLIDSSFGCVST